MLKKHDAARPHTESQSFSDLLNHQQFCTAYSTFEPLPEFEIEFMPPSAQFPLSREGC